MRKDRRNHQRGECRRFKEMLADLKQLKFLTSEFQQLICSCKSLKNNGLEEIACRLSSKSNQILFHIQKIKQSPLPAFTFQPPEMLTFVQQDAAKITSKTIFEGNLITEEEALRDIRKSADELFLSFHQLHRDLVCRIYAATPREMKQFDADVVNQEDLEEQFKSILLSK